MRVTAAPVNWLQRACACGQHTAGGGECAECRKKRESTLQRAAAGPANGVAPPIVHDVLRAPGQPLDVATRAFLEPRFGHDFSGVRVHTDDRAAESARAVNALAYTVGRNVVFGAGQYAPGTSGGQKLLAHELTHVVQQRGNDAPAGDALSVGRHDDVYEQEANQLAAVIPHLETARPEQTGRPALALHMMGPSGKVQRAKGELFGALGGALVGGIIGGLVGGVPGAIIGGLVGAGVGALIAYLFRGSKVKVDASCKNFCPGVDFEKEGQKADAKTSSPCKNVKFTYQVQGEASTRTFDQKIDFSPVTIKCDPAIADCGGWSSKGVITLGKSACNAGTCGPLASTILHEMVHDWAGWGPPYDKQNITVPGATHTTPDYLDEWIARFVEKSCFGTDPWGLP
jgi:hypothetical protein